MAKNTIDPNVKKVVRFFVKRLEEDGVKVGKVVVFGSHHKGTATEDSDIDLIIVSESFRRKGLFNRADMISRARGDTVRKFLVGMDVKMETPEEFNPDFGTVVFAA